MRPIAKKWKVASPDPHLQKLLIKKINLSPITAQLLINRGINDPVEASSFITPALKDLHDPFLMKGMDKAAKRVIQSLIKKEKIYVYGDYDVDGTSAAVLLYLFLKEVGADVSAHIPERIGQGYGLKKEVIKRLHDEGASLIITTDCGISNTSEIAYASELGIDTIVTDHHEVPVKPPQALAVINPKQNDCPFPFKGLAGVGVAFNLVIAVRSLLRDEGLLEKERIPNLRRYLDIVALGTLADVVPLVDENRIIAAYGLEEIGRELRPGIRALKEVSNLKGYLKSWSVVFQLVPRLNAAGRLGDSSLAFKLLTAESFDEALSVAKTLDKMNTERKEMVTQMLQDALQKIEKTADSQTYKVLVLSSSEWHPGIIGIVASRLVETFCKPVVLIAIKDGMGRGSARSVDGVSVLGLLRECDMFFEAYGGHNQAAGFTIKEDEIKGFSEAMKDIAAREVRDEDLMQEISLDGMVELHELSEDVVVEIEKLAPFGSANPEPLLGLAGTRITQSKIVGDNHLKMTLKQKNSVGNAIGFNLADSVQDLLAGARKDTRNNSLSQQLSGIKFDVACTPFMDKWNGKNNVKLKVKDIKNI